MIFANATVVCFVRSSNEPMQPTQYSTSGFSPRAARRAVDLTRLVDGAPVRRDDADGFAAVSALDDDEFRGLAKAMRKPELAGDERFATVEARLVEGRFPRGRGAHGAGADALAVAEDGDAIGEREDFLEAMGDVDDADAVGAEEPAQGRAEAVGRESAEEACVAAEPAEMQDAQAAEPAVVVSKPVQAAAEPPTIRPPDMPGTRGLPGAIGGAPDSRPTPPPLPAIGIAPREGDLINVVSVEAFPAVTTPPRPPPCG